MAASRATVKSEYSLFVRRYAPFASFGGGFEGDDRLYSTDMNATSRTVGVAIFGPKPSTVAGDGYSSGSAYTGPWEVRKKLDLSTVGSHLGQVNASVSDEKFGDGTVAFTIYTEGNLPLKDIMLHEKIASGVDSLNKLVRPASRNPQGTPDIDTFVDFKATFAGDKIEFEGTVRGDGFPNAEIYVMDSDFNAFGLLDYRTKSGITGPLFRLFGSGRSNTIAKFERKVSIDPYGYFTGDFAWPPPVTQEL